MTKPSVQITKDAVPRLCLSKISIPDYKKYYCRSGYLVFF
jgi:hypothetical protein